MIKTTLKIDGMMCGMCESHMNDVIRKNFKVKKSDIFRTGWGDGYHQRRAD